MIIQFGSPTQCFALILRRESDALPPPYPLYDTFSAVTVMTVALDPATNEALARTPTSLLSVVSPNNESFTTASVTNLKMQGLIFRLHIIQGWRRAGSVCKMEIQIGVIRAIEVIHLLILQGRTKSEVI